MNISMQSLSPLIHLIDDDAAVRESLALLISTVGLRVQTWAAPEAFMREFDRASIGAIVLDVRMPGISGLTVLDTLIREGVDQPIIMLTGHGTVEMCRRAFKSGAAEFLEKPVDDEVLLEERRPRIARTLRPTLRKRTRSAQPHRSGPDQQGNRPRPHAVTTHRRDAPRQFVREAGSGNTRRFDTPVCGVGRSGLTDTFAVSGSSGTNIMGDLRSQYRTPTA